jgi:hypothetical protein
MTVTRADVVAATQPARSQADLEKSWQTHPAAEQMTHPRLEDPSPEGDLIDSWLDEGDRLSESARTSSAGRTVHKRRPLAGAVAGLRALAHRHRLFFVIGAVAASVIAVVAFRAWSQAMLRTEKAVVAEPARPATPIPVRPAPVAVALPDPPPAAASVPAAPAAVPPAPAPAAAGAPAPDLRDPGAVPDPAAASADDALLQCQAALRRGRAKAAVAACEKVARERPSSAEALVLLAHANLLAGWEGATLQLARRASFLDPKCADAFLLIGTVQQAAGRTRDARSAYQDYLRLAPRGSHADEVRAILKTL